MTLYSAARMDTAFARAQTQADMDPIAEFAYRNNSESFRIGTYSLGNAEHGWNLYRANESE